MSKGPGSRHFAAQIRRNQELAAKAADSGIRPALMGLQRWQQARLRQTYADLEAQPRFSAACVFFVEELYGGRDAELRDSQLARAAPVMQGMMPDHLLLAIGEALHLQAISLELDMELAGYLPDCQRISQPEYAGAYRRMDAWAEREEQIQLIGKLGRLLEETVRKRFVHGLVHLMQKPARVAGFGRLQEFIEHGLDAFAAMDGAEEFIATIEQRERRALEAMRRGSDWPFEPWIGRGP